ncbi:zinc finger protein 26-like [Synchiropus splendidus]|uniref:zinc finger protein 26-like n=1 Tax=Synchiropus splendidus TaxID=270530 RepID=UPI00237E8E39|nr:zinc finger protein 26-like [Synchiropus splendidus]
MSVLTSQTLRDQLSGILAALTRAAVEEILGLMDEGYAVLQTEIARSHKENQDLRKKLHLIESIIGRGTCGGLLAGPTVVEKQPEPTKPQRAEEPELPDVVLIKDEDTDTDSNDGFSQEPTHSDSAVKTKPAEGRKSPTHTSTPVYQVDSPRSEPSCSTPLCMDTAGASQLTLHGSQMDSVMEPCSEGAELDSTWSKPSQSHVTFPQYGQSEDGESFNLVITGVRGSGSQEPQLLENTTFQYEFCRDSKFGDSRTQRFVCAVCNKTYATSQNLAVHMRTHTGERPFSCTQCGKKFTQSAHLKSHLSIHSGMRPFNCSLCSRGFISKYSLRLHMKKQHSNI